MPYFCGMKHFVRQYRNWRYRKLYKRLFLIYSAKSASADFAGVEAAAAFQWLTGHEWAKWLSRNRGV